jgi:hypothetical protein
MNPPEGLPVSGLNGRAQWAILGSDEERPMHIEITRPEVEFLIQQSLQRGGFADAEDVILRALQLLAAEPVTGAELVAVMQASPHKEIELAPVQQPKVDRQKKLS